MIADDRHAALRADVLLAVTAGGHDLGEVAPALAPASDFYARHAGFKDLPSHVAWRWGRPTSANLHDTEQAIVEHVVGTPIVEADRDGRDLRDAQRMWQRATDRLRCASGATRSSGATSSWRYSAPPHQRSSIWSCASTTTSKPDTRQSRRSGNGSQR